MLPKILVVDDEEIVRELICQRLEELGFMDLSRASSGDEVIALLESGRRFDLIISDQCMENGTGMDIICYLIKKNVRCPFIFFTGSPLLVEFSYDWFLGVVEKTNIEELEGKLAKVFPKN